MRVRFAILFIVLCGTGWSSTRSYFNENQNESHSWGGESLYYPHLWDSPIRVGVVSEMFKCQHQLAMCKLHDCQKCEYHAHESECPYARNLAGDTMPTFREAISAYMTGNACRSRKNQIRHMVENSVKCMGLSLDDKCMEMTYTRFETLLERLSDPLRPGGVLRPVTVKDYLDAFQAITSPTRENVKYLKNIGRDPFRFSVPAYKPQRTKKQTVTEEQARRVIVSMERLFATGKQSDRSVALFLFFELFMQMRAGDVCRLKWGNIRQTTHGIMLVYTPHKTEKSSGVEVAFVIDPMEYQIIKPYIGPDDAYVIPRHDNYTGAHTTRHGDYAGAHLYQRRRANKLISEAGIGNDYRGQKRGHALRKFRETLMATKVGAAEASARSGHSLRTAQQSYIGSEHSLVSNCM